MNLYSLLQYCFTGFGIYIFLNSILKQFKFYKKKEKLKLIEEAALLTVCFAGLIYTLYWFFDIILDFFSYSEENRNILEHRMFGKYWFGFWLQPLLYILTSQLLWIKFINKKTCIQLVLGILLFFNIETYVIITTSLHRDYLPSSWTIYGGYSIFGWIISDWIIKSLIFSFFVSIVYLIKSKKLSTLAPQ